MTNKDFPVNFIVKGSIKLSTKAIFFNPYITSLNYLNTLEHKHIIPHFPKILEYMFNNYPVF